jgi:F420-dependent oxidoreductase-like protein
MKIGIWLGKLLQRMTIDDLIDQAREAAAAGLTSAWMAQLFNWDALTTLAVIGRDVPQLELGTAVVPTYPRHPLVLASQALTVQAVTGNRLTLGIGPSHRYLMEDQLGYSFDRPARHVREYLSALMPALRGESVDYQGETLKAVGTVDVPGAVAPSLLLSALGPVMLRMAGELTDGTITVWTGPKTIADHIAPTLTRAAVGRPAPRIVAVLLTSVTSDANAARTWIAERFGLADQPPSYRAMLEREDAQPEDVVLVGNEIEVERELQRYLDAGATELVAIPFGSDEEQARTIALLSDLARSDEPDRSIPAVS